MNYVDVTLAISNRLGQIKTSEEFKTFSMLTAPLLTTAGQSSPGSSGDAVDTDVEAAALHSGAAAGEGLGKDLRTACRH